MSKSTLPLFELKKNIIYAIHDSIELNGDLYTPTGNGLFPVLITVHGGGWVRGARSQFQNWATFLASHGYAIFNITYRFAGTGSKMFPGSVQDIRSAVQFIRATSKEHSIDSERIGLFGASAGAHLSALAALGHDDSLFANGYPKDEHKSKSAKVKALLGFYGIYDLAEMWHHYRIQSPGENNLTKYLGCELYENRKVYFDSSPISYAITKKSELSVFLSVGTDDDLVHKEAQTDAFLLALKQAGFFVRCCVVPGAPHFYVSDPFEEEGSFTNYVAPRLLRFLKEKL